MTRQQGTSQQGASAKAAEARSQKTERHSMRLYPEDYDTLTYWSERYAMDKTEFLVTAMYHYVKHRNGDYDLPVAEIQRLNQLVDVVGSLVSSQEALQKTVVSGLDSLIGISRGDNYLVEDESGEL